MRYKLKCTQPGCEGTCWVNGDHESDTNAVNLDESDEMEDACEHMRSGGSYEIVDEESRDDESEDWML